MPKEHVVTTNEIMGSLNELTEFLQDNMLIKEEAFATFVTKEDLKNELSGFATKTEAREMKIDLQTEMREMKDEIVGLLQTETHEMKIDLRTEMREMKDELNEKIDLCSTKDEMQEMKIELTEKIDLCSTKDEMWEMRMNLMEKIDCCSTKDEMREMKSEIIEHIDDFAKGKIRIDDELVAHHNRMNRITEGLNETRKCCDLPPVI